MTRLDQIRSRCPVFIAISDEHPLSGQLEAMTGDGWNSHDWTNTLGSGEIVHKRTGLRVAILPENDREKLLNALETLLAASIDDLGDSATFRARYHANIAAESVIAKAKGGAA